jgi:pimeloyl-ACP methyl ester carboxylesterase
VANKPETKYATSGDLSIAYQVVGEGPVDVVFVPGFMSHVELNWDYVFMSSPLERLAQFSRMVVFDKRGSGLSDRSLGAGTLEDRMDDLRAVMDDVGLERAAVVGVSNGAPLAAMFAATYPQRVSALVLFLSSCPGVRPPSPEFEAVLTLVRDFWTTGLVLNTIIQHAPDPDEAIVQLARFERYCCTAAVAVEIMRRGYESDLTPFLPLIQTPTLVINNRDDPIVPLEESIYLAEHIPHARHVILDGDFHASWRPSDFDEPLRLLEMFLTGERGSVVTAADRVLATVLFTDIVQSTDHAVDLGDANWRHVLDRYDDLCRDEVARHRGVFVKNTGDGMLSHFDSPGRAVACAQELSEKVGALGLRTRAGVHTGEVELRGADLSGVAVHIAARVMGTGDAGEVIVSRTVRDLTIGGYLEFEDHGEHTLRGVPGTWSLFAVH